MGNKSFLAFSALLWSVGLAAAQGTSFTFQGHLLDRGQPASGTYDMVFTVLNSDGTLALAPGYTNSVVVTQGQFMVTLPAPTAVFSGARRFLEIAVRTNGAAGAFTTLTPPQEISSAPYATRAAAAGVADTTASVPYQSISAAHILAEDLPGPDKILIYNGKTWMWTNLPAASAAWRLAGNAGTTPGSNFIGTVDAQPLELRVNRQRVQRFEPGAGVAPNLLGGSASNTISAGVTGATIAGGGSAAHPSSVTGDFGAIGGGIDNSAAELSSVAGGEMNTASGDHAAIGGGFFNEILPGLDDFYGGTLPASSSVIGGGELNQVFSIYSVISGGSENTLAASTGNSFLGGGYLNTVESNAFFATLGGGMNNRVGSGAAFGFLGGGEDNLVGLAATNAVVGGGFNNTAGGVFATVPGGSGNTASGRSSFAAGQRANAAHEGTFVWADPSGSNFVSTASNQFLIRAAGGVGVGTNHPQAPLHVRGTVMADRFLGDGTGLNLSNAINTAALQNSSITASKMASNQVVKTLNGLTDNVTLAPGANITLVSNGSTLTISSTGGGTASNVWNLSGNAGTSSNHFLGTLDNHPLEFRVNNSRALRLEPNNGGSPNVIGGFSSNLVAPGVVGATIAGGGDVGIDQSAANFIAGDFGAIGGGQQNTIGTSRAATIGGGQLNTIQDAAFDAVVAGGQGNTIRAGSYSVIGGGLQNSMDGNGTGSSIGGGSFNLMASNVSSSVISGGYNNAISNNAQYATVPGGYQNVAWGSYSLAAGRQAKAIHPGTFVWADSTTADFASTGSNQFLIRAGSGVGIGTNRPQAQLHVRGTNMADFFRGTFLGDAAGLTNLPTGGGVPANTAFLNSNQLFTAANTFSSVLIATNPANSFSGNGAQLSSLNAGNLTGTVPVAALGNAWKITGNAGTSPAVNFLGTTDGQALVLKAGGGVGIGSTSPIAPFTVIGARAGNYSTPITHIENTNATGNSGPALRLAASANTVDGVLNVSAFGVGKIAAFGAGTIGEVLNLDTNGSFNFGSRTRQMLNLYGASYGAGVQSLTLYNRSDGGFAWYRSGAHTNNQNDPGPGGSSLMTLSSGGYLTAFGGMEAQTGAGTIQLRNDSGFAPGINIVNSPNAGVMRFRNRLEIWPNDAGTAPGNLDIRDNTGAAMINLSAVGPAFFTGGNVGIGTNNPQTALHVAGTARASLFQGDGSGLTNLNLGSVALLSNAWKTTGNTASSGDFLGTLNPVPLEFRANNIRALRIMPAAVSTDGPNLVGGYVNNTVGSGVSGATIAGGGMDKFEHKVTANFGTVGGGSHNAAGQEAVVAGGSENVSGALQSAVGGGHNNNAGANYATIAGGSGNAVSMAGGSVLGGIGNQVMDPKGANSTILGGSNNLVSGSVAATVAGGANNRANGDYSFAAGHLARADHPGSFVWGDSSGQVTTSANSNQFIVRAVGGLWFGVGGAPSVPAGRYLNTSTGGYLSSGGVWTDSSDRNAKKSFAAVNGQEVLARVAQLPISTWTYRAEDDSVKHLGPVAQDFYDAFALGQDNLHIAALDSAGVALAAIQGLNEKCEETAKDKDSQIAALRKKSDALEERVAELEKLMQKLARAQASR